jgi:hypothetical protein
MLGLTRRGGQVLARMLPNVRHQTIQPMVAAAVARETRIDTDDHANHPRPPQRGGDAALLPVRSHCTQARTPPAWDAGRIRAQQHPDTPDEPLRVP